MSLGSCSSAASTILMVRSGKLFPSTLTRNETVRGNTRSCVEVRHRRHASASPLGKDIGQKHTHSADVSGGEHVQLSKIAKQKEADREFFTNLLSSAATKRDAKAYISRLKSPSKVESKPLKPRSTIPQVNLGGLFRNARAVEQSPVFSQYDVQEKGYENQETLHVALVKLGDLEQTPDNLIVGIAETLCQLSRLSMLPCIVLEASTDVSGESRQSLKVQAERLAAAIDAFNDPGARLVEDILTISTSGEIVIGLRKLLFTPLRRKLIPIIIPSAYSEDLQKIMPIAASDAVLALTAEFAELKAPTSLVEGHTLSKQVSLDRIISIDNEGGIANANAADGKHVFVNLEQEFSTITQQLQIRKDGASSRQLRNLSMFRVALKHLPPTASGLMVTHKEAANVDQLPQYSSPSQVGTRRQKNALIHNLLTDKPAYSSSLPKGRLMRQNGNALASPVATFVKHGMPLTILPDPQRNPWTTTSVRIKLTDPQIDLEKLVYLIDDSFNRQLDIENYLKRVNDRIAGVIIAGDYEGGAILTWEAPPGVDIDDTDRLVPYLDKFAVLKRSQGAGGVADIVFNAMVRTCFPRGVCWRSRKNNPVNKWYFERSRGTKKIPDMNWTMFWTTPGVPEDTSRFADYEAVCRGVEPTWLDKKMAAD